MSYAEALLDFRRRKDEHFATGRGPIAGPELQGFTGLHYFDPDEAWQFQVPLLPAAAAQPEVPLQTSTGEIRFMALLGQVEFPASGTQRSTLSVFGPPGETQPARVFIPFRDATSGRETYGAGRYLDAPVEYGAQGPQVTLDFNLAYHPYCAYSEGWTCPLPPAENVLSVAVAAGERLP
ncbi:DUF1684 domain-containing protein [Deinococcus sp.]|uniref:DUF1684 domain-containing protein n=1 Tax=Deinococcus sp. TaxID=47478 RepID=UPI00345D6A03